MRATSVQEDEDEELLDDHVTDLEVVHAAAVQASGKTATQPDPQLLYPAREIQFDDGARPEWGVSPEERGAENLAVPDQPDEMDWRLCLTKRNAEFQICGRVTTRRNLLRVVLSPAAVLLLAILMMVLWLARGGTDDENSSVSGTEATADTGEFVQFG